MTPCSRANFAALLPVRNDFFFPLPVLHLGVFGRPAVGDPVWLGVLGSAAGTTGKTDDDFHAEDFGEEDGLSKGVDVFLGVLGIGVNRVAVTTEGGNLNSAVFKFFQPGFGFGLVGDEFVERAMGIVGIAARADLHGFEAEGGDLVQHGVEGQMVVDGIENANGDLAHIASRPGRWETRTMDLGFCRVGEHFSPRNGRSE